MSNTSDGNQTKAKQNNSTIKQAANSQDSQNPQQSQVQQGAQKLEGQIENVENKLQNMPTSALKNISNELETIEKSALMQKIDNQLHDLKDIVAKPGDTDSASSAGANEQQQSS
jgi:hypothetical protein